MSDGIEALPASQYRRDNLDWPPDPARGVLMALAIAVPFWALVGGAAWMLLG